MPRALAARPWVPAHAEQFVRWLRYAGTATLLAFVISFPLAYFIAFKAGRWKNLMLLLIILPFFTSCLMRTVAWQTILSDNARSEERRVGKECRSRWSPYH